MKVSQEGEQVRHDLPRRDGRSPGRKLVNGSAVRDGHRFLSSVDAATRAQVVGKLQGSLGNAAVQRLAESDPVVQRAMTTEFKIEHSLIKNPVLAESYSMGASGGKKAAETTDIVFVKAMDENTPGLMKALVDHDVIPKVELDLSKTETSESGVETKTAVLGYVFENANVTNVQHAGSKESATETVSLSFEKMKIKSPEGKEMEHDTKGAEAK